MKAMILAAGSGVRMRPLTDHTPKPLLKVNDQALIEYHLYALAQVGIREVVINVSYFAEQIVTALGDGRRYGVSIEYSYELNVPLGPAGGVFHALPLLGHEPFILLSADIWSDYPFAQLPKEIPGLAHLVLVPTQGRYKGDFYLADGCVVENGEEILTYGNMCVCHPQLFIEHQAKEFGPILRHAIRQGKVTGECYRGQFVNVSTPRDLAACSYLIDLP